MIITMQDGVGRHVVEYAIKFFQQKGCDVQVKNGKGNPVTLAVLGVAVERLSTDRPPLIKKEEKENDFFVKHHLEFVEAWEWKATE